MHTLLNEVLDDVKQSASTRVFTKVADVADGFKVQVHRSHLFLLLEVVEEENV